MRKRKSAVLHLVVCFRYFDAIISGEKTEEYRLTSAYWRNRLQKNKYDSIRLQRGYTSTTLTLPYRGYTIRRIRHEFFGEQSVQVFALPLR